MERATALNLQELQRYLSRVGDRWPLQVVMVGGARVDDFRGARSQRERGPEYVVILVSRAFDGMPWLERVYQATSLWDALEMRGPADVHCYTSAEFLRKRDTAPRVKAVVDRGLLLFEDSQTSARSPAASGSATSGSATSGSAVSAPPASGPASPRSPVS